MQIFGDVNSGWHDPRHRTFSVMGFEEWNATLRASCGHYYGEPSHQQDNAGQFRLHHRAGVDVAEVHCTIDRIERNRAGIRQDEAEHLFLLVQHAGETQIRHFGRREVLAAGECILLDSTQPAELGYGGKETVFVSAHLPRALCLDGRTQEISIARKIAVDHPHSHSFRALLTQGRQAGLAFLSDLIGLAFSNDAPPYDATRIRNRSDRFGFITGVLDRNLTDAEMSLDRLAALVHISRRQLQREFRDHDSNFTDYLRCKRLKYVAENLRHATRMQQVPHIAELAYRAGFGDISHFNRSFRVRYGLSPSDFLLETAERLKEN